MADSATRRRTDRYEAVGLRHNPFAAPDRGDGLGEAFADRGLPDPPPPGSSTLVQVIGDAGAGKSSQLRHWQATRPGPWHWIPREPYRARWKQPPVVEDATVYGDEIDRMPIPLRAHWFRRLAAVSATVVVGTHADLSKPAARAGFEVVTHRLVPVDRAFVERMILLRLHDASAAEAAPFAFTSAALDEVMRTSNGNLRDADVECHRQLAIHVADR